MPIGRPRSIVPSCVLLVVSITEMVSSYVLGTNRRLPQRAMPGGGWPTVMSPVTVNAPLLMLTMEMVPSTMLPVGYWATTGVPLEYSWKSFAVAIRPASLETYAVLPSGERMTLCGTLPTRISALLAGVAPRVSLASVSLLSSTTYASLPSDETAMPVG